MRRSLSQQLMLPSMNSTLRLVNGLLVFLPVSPPVWLLESSAMPVSVIQYSILILGPITANCNTRDNDESHNERGNG
ncbi:hypothetical protein YC2023_065346 [Brassica napus]